MVWSQNVVRSGRMAEEQKADVWASGESYEPYVGRWSRLVAKEFLGWLDVRPQCRWLDVGCGTGALSETILDVADPLAITGVDPSTGFVEYARRQIRDDRVSFKVGDAQALPIEVADYDAVVSGLVLNFVPDPRIALREMKRTSSVSGVVGFYVWDYAGEMQMMRYFWDAAVAVDPAATERDEGRRFPICQPEPLRSLLVDAELRDIEVRAIDVPTLFRDFDDYWSPFLGGQGSAPAYAMSLSEEERLELREEVRRNLPVQADGSIRLSARAWAAKGTRRA